MADECHIELFVPLPPRWH